MTLCPQLNDQKVDLSPAWVRLAEKDNLLEQAGALLVRTEKSFFLEGGIFFGRIFILLSPW